MARGRRKARGRRRKGFTLPLAVVAGFAIPTAKIVIHTQHSGFVNGGIREAGRILVGFDHMEGRFNLAWLFHGLLPIIAGGVIHKFIGNRLGINRAMSSAGIPLIRL